ncbi:MAG: hypothetical protein E7058_10265 [Lentisphaerae bacterium]|nr:hypothetical protein [Lentisphaerota bacterium]
MALYIMSGVVLLAIVIAVVVLWKISRWILIPVQIVLFLILLYIGFRIFLEYSRDSKNADLRKINTQLQVFKREAEKSIYRQIR